MIDWNRIAHPSPTTFSQAQRVEDMLAGSANKAAFDSIATSHDRWDYVHFRDIGLSRSSDVWDNRRKVVA